MAVSSVEAPPRGWSSDRATGSLLRLGIGLAGNPLTRFIVRRLAIAVVTIWGATTLIFLLLRLGGDPAAAFLPVGATHADLAAVNKALGFDRPLLTQYGDYLRNALHGNLGDSYGSSTSALSLVEQRLPVTLKLALYSFVLGLAAAIATVVAAHLVPNRRIRSMLRTALLWLGSVRQAIPIYLFAILTVLIFSVSLGWLPSIGDSGFKAYVLPVLTLATFEYSLYVRLLDAAMIEQSRLDFVRTASAKGISTGRIVLRHILPNAAVPLITVAALNFANLMGGVVVIEVVFNWQGLGNLVFTSINNRDIPTVQAALLLTALIFVGINLAADLIHMAIDPRVRPR